VWFVAYKKQFSENNSYSWFVVYECNLIRHVYIVGFKEGRNGKSEEFSQVYSHMHLLML
jgi:hypothetical protein